MNRTRIDGCDMSDQGCLATSTYAVNAVSMGAASPGVLDLATFAPFVGKLDR